MKILQAGINIFSLKLVLVGISNGVHHKIKSAPTFAETVDLPASTLTSGVLPVGGFATGSISPNGDRDWYRVDLKGGQTYTFDLLGSASGSGTLTDPFLYLYKFSPSLFGGSVSLVASDDDSAGGLQSRIVYTPTVDATFYLAAAGYNDTTLGTYNLPYGNDRHRPFEAVGGSASNGLF